MKSFALGLIRFYQAQLSPLSPPRCRYVPSCSEYGVQAIKRHGVLRGCWLTLRRLCRCNPLFEGGIDPVP